VDTPDDLDLMFAWFDREGNRIGLFRYVELKRRQGYDRIGDTLIGNVRVSTVWLGSPWSLSRPPMIFESAVFGGTGTRWVQRYATEPAALAGHDQLVAWVRDGMPDRDPGFG